MPRNPSTYKIYRGEELKLLVHKAKAGNQAAWKKLQRSMYVFVADVANQLRYNQHNHSYEFKDLVAEGMLGVKVALDHFDEERGVKFPSYAVWWIRNAINNFIDKNSSIVNASVEYARALHGHIKYKQVIGGEYIIDEEHLEKRFNNKTKAKRLAAGLTALKTLRMDVPMDNQDGSSNDWSECIPDKSIEPTYDTEELDRLVRLFCRNLSREHTVVFKMRFLHGMNLRDTAKQAGVSRETARVVSESLIENFREFVRAEGFESAGDFIVYDPNENISSVPVK